MFGLVEGGRHGVALVFEFDPAFVAGHVELRIAIQQFPSVVVTCDLACQSLALARRCVAWGLSQSLCLRAGRSARLVVVGCGVEFRFAGGRRRIGSLLHDWDRGCHCLLPVGGFRRSRAVRGHPRRPAASAGRGCVCWLPPRWGTVIS